MIFSVCLEITEQKWADLRKHFTSRDKDHYEIRTFYLVRDIMHMIINDENISLKVFLKLNPDYYSTYNWQIEWHFTRYHVDWSAIWLESQDQSMFCFYYRRMRDFNQSEWSCAKILWQRVKKRWEWKSVWLKKRKGIQRTAWIKEELYNYLPN